MRIKSIKVANHRAVPDLDIEVHNHLVLVGPNECGKTSLLGLLDAVLSGSQAQLYGSLDLEVLRDASLPAEVTVVFVEFSTDEQAAFADQILVPSDPEEDPTLTLRLVVRAEPGSEEVVIERGFLKPGLPLRATYEQLQWIGWAYLPAGRSPDRELGPNRRSAVRVLLGGIDLGDSEEEIRDAVTALHGVIDSADALGSLRGEIAQALAGLLPRSVAEEDVVLRLPNADEVDPLADVDLHLQDADGRKRSLRQQSDGVRAMSTVAVQLLTRGTASIIAVDEPEIHLHPRAQAQLARRLNGAAGQRVVATHSPAVLERFSPLDVVAFVPGRAPRQLESHPFADEPKLAEHWWTAATLEPVTSRAAILVEGIADRVLIEAVARACGYDLDRLGIFVMELGGSGAFGPSIRLFGTDGFGVPLAGLVDEAEAGDVASALGVAEADIASHRFQVARPDLEGECVAGLGVGDHLALLVESGHYEEEHVVKGCGASSASLIDPDDYLAWCGRKRNKVRVAVALAAALTEPAARSLRPLLQVIEDAVEAAQNA
ncbi:ATP-dependent nuclease [Actinomarinicola tropica]|uniref:AAA family ATPase n=1 Tax=Actinomarinicola tropica TaxID=2789776 RepID=A0A5Q2RMY7_9ACTN|nr:AAA family ATPase [Actinomarinicola tropica]QGG95447.1 AAA family ATPase [Actinomarinicola tropica]